MFKLVCGAGNEDIESVKRLVYVYALAGCKIFDLSARKEILEAAKEASKLAGVNDIQFCISIGIKGDKHISKAYIDNSKCISCENCIKNCPNEAVISNSLPNRCCNSHSFKQQHLSCQTDIAGEGNDSHGEGRGGVTIIEKKCIGCGICSEKCPVGAIQMTEKDINYKELLPELVQNGADIIELHIMGHDKDDLAKKWQVINECKPKLASICIDRENFGNKEVLERIKEMISVRKPYTTIIQADGVPMSGGSDDYKTTLQAVAMAEVIQNANLPVYIMMSGGTNSKTAELAKLCGIDYWGIAIGSWARKIVKPYVARDDFWENQDVQKEAVKIAKELVEKCV